MCVYVPCVPDDLNRESLCQILHEQGIGHVRRIDIVNCEKRGKMVRRAYINLSMWYNTASAHTIYQTIMTSGCMYVWYDPRKFFVLNKMTGAMSPDTEMNIHQVAYLAGSAIHRLDTVEAATSARTTKVDSEMGEMRQRLVDQQDRIAKLEDQIRRLLGPEEY
jgi:hypothetical protein